MPAMEDPALTSIESMIITLSEIRLIPPEVSLGMMEGYIRPMINDLPRMADQYDPQLNTWVHDESDEHRRGHWLSNDERPTTRVLNNRLDHIRETLLAIVDEEIGHLEDHVHNLAAPNYRR